MLLPTDRDVLRELAAVLALRVLVGAGRRDRARIAAIGVVPRRGAAGRLSLERGLRRARLALLVLVVEHVAEGAADEAAADHAGGDAEAAPAKRGRHQPADRGAAETTDRCFGVVLHACTAHQAERQREQTDDARKLSMCHSSPPRRGMVSRL